ncbi:MAG TPA: hypothetical protein DEA55_11515 [Rhodospirillaceae bacterium]|nr:hypothetical protein [Rhodospirillaceae bacterium]
MFHRVKSEENHHEDLRDDREDQRNRIIPNRDLRAEADEAEEEREVVQPQLQPQIKKVAPYERILTSNQKKEPNPMTAQAEDNNAGNDRSERQPELARPRSFEPYQRPQQPGRVATGGYPGAYPGSSYAAPTMAAAPAPSASNIAEKNQNAERTLTIGAGITMSGEIESCDQLIVEGTIEASLKGARVLEVAETGTFYGTVEIDEAVIAGRFEGDIAVNGRLVLKRTSTITGSIAYRELEVEAGAVIEGKIMPLKQAQAEAAPRKAKEVSVKGSESKERQSSAPANSDGHGLFAQKAMAAE